MNGGKGIYVGGTLVSILISLALYYTGRREAQPQPPVAPVDPPLASPRVLLRRPDRPTIAGTADQDFRDFLRGFRDRVRS